MTEITQTQRALAVQDFMPAMNIQEAISRRQAIVEFVKALMVEGTDYGKIPGAGDKPTLLKPGAEKLCTLFGLTTRFELVRSVEDWTGEAHSAEPFFVYYYRASLYRGEILISQGEGSCNSWEKKYRYRKSSPTCPTCGKELRLSKNKPEWYCWAKQGGCGATFPKDAPNIQPGGVIKNPDAADTVNTLQKMAQKRALIAATLLAVNASEFFTQDIEDMDYGDQAAGPIIENAPAPKKESNGNSNAADREALYQDPDPYPMQNQPATSGEGAQKSSFRDVKIQTARWKDMQAVIARALPRYQKDGQPDPIHILAALSAQGVRVIGDSTTAEELIAELKLRHPEEATA